MLAVSNIWIGCGLGVLSIQGLACGEAWLIGTRLDDELQDVQQKDGG